MIKRYVCVVHTFKLELNEASCIYARARTYTGNIVHAGNVYKYK